MIWMKGCARGDSKKNKIGRRKQFHCNRDILTCRPPGIARNLKALSYLEFGISWEKEERKGEKNSM